MILIMIDKHTRLEPDSLNSLTRISYNSAPLSTEKSTPLFMPQRPVEVATSFVKASKFSWTSYVKTYHHSYGWNLKQFSFAFICFIKRGFTSFL